MSTFAGRALVAGVAIKAVAFLIGLLPEPLALAHDIVDTFGDIGLLGGGAVVLFRLIRRGRHQLLWRVRRKLILSYVFMGVVPAMLIITFFLLCGLLMFYNVSAYLMQSQMQALTEEARFLAQGASFEIEGATTSTASVAIIERRQAAAALRYPGVSFAVVPAPATCRQGTGNVNGVAAGAWAHRPVPVERPEWTPCEGYSGLIAYIEPSDPAVPAAPRVTRLVARSVAIAGPAPNEAVVVDVPIGTELVRRLREDSGIELGAVTALNGADSLVRPLEVADDLPVRTGVLLPTGGIYGSPAAAAAAEEASGGLLRRPLEWVSLLDYTDWSNGQTGAVAVAIRMSVADLYTRISSSPIERIGNISFGQLLLVGLALVASSFLVIQIVALAMGFALAKSITGSVHALFAGTERVRQGDFAHKIPIQSQDQLGELAESFNSMTASIEDLLEQKAEKERMEQELRIARQIQMSLLPQGQIQIPGLALVGHCEPAREVGGDYYDFLPLQDGRLGVLIADVAGKGTSAALYMAELKGLMLSLSQLHRSPRQLLVDANRIIAPQLDDRTFITMTYAVVDPLARTFTYARAGHCPLIYRSGLAGGGKAELMAPPGLVLGLKIDNGEMFDRLLEEVTIPLHAGDLIVLFTDGITEAMDVADDCFGETRLGELVEEHGDGSPDLLRERILRDIKAFTGSAAQHDDMTMLLLKVDDQLPAR